eukprot:CAMPEP_0198660560 /NCGR_PEP_ID=MMETSP1467-20131203/37507_1 /TAXON_ID=1462469 /ORGANISM="unid. sp., Strain CCMP2135" /LENGTH=233 /DNA_ID=CAMNT_0044396967 /DNA_START=22 /DNA_END=721 /DNA_ORIENTATION=-
MSSSPTRKTSGPRFEALLVEELTLLLSSWLTSKQTTWLRAASRECSTRFIRNCPAGYKTERGVVAFVEQMEQAQRAGVAFQPVSGANRHSPLRCFRVDALALARAAPESAMTLLRDRDIALATMSTNPLSLQYLPETLKDDRGVVLEAVTVNGMALEFASTNLRDDRDLVMAAIGPDRAQPPGDFRYYTGTNEENSVVLLFFFFFMSDTTCILLFFCLLSVEDDASPPVPTDE